MTTPEIIAAWREGRTLADIAADLGVTRQAVSARVRRHRTPMDVRAHRRAVAELAEQAARVEREAAERAAAEHLAATGHPCAIPGCGVVVPARRRTCCPEHARLWPVIRRHVNEEARRTHLRSQAKKFIREGTAARLDWADRIMDGADAPPLRPPRPGSAVEAALAEIGVAA